MQRKFLGTVCNFFLKETSCIVRHWQSLTEITFKRYSMHDGCVKRWKELELINEMLGVLKGKLDSKKNIISSNQKAKAPPHGWVLDVKWWRVCTAMSKSKHCSDRRSFSENVLNPQEVVDKLKTIKPFKPFVDPIGLISQIGFETSWKWPKFCCAGILASVRDVRDYPKQQLS